MVISLLWVIKSSHYITRVNVLNLYTLSMTGTIPTNTKNTHKPYKQGVFEVYLLWRSVQGFMGHTKAQEVIHKVGSSNSELSKIFSISTQTEFAKVYKIENSTLTNWNKLIDREDLLKDVLAPMKRLTKNVMCSLYKNILDNGKAEEVRLWLQCIEGWTYQSSHHKEPRELTVATITYGTI